MGNCTTRSSEKKKKTKGDKASDDISTQTNTHKEETLPKEDVTYAIIDHSNSKTSGRIRGPHEDDCDYAIVHVPSELEPEPEPESEPESSAKEDCGDDYVLMG
ncbi:uncharacterized protein ACJ7VT_014569 [Polymixia lowei]